MFRRALFSGAFISTRITPLSSPLVCPLNLDVADLQAMRVLGFLHAHAGAGFRAGMVLQASAPSPSSSLRAHPPPPRPLLPAAWPSSSSWKEATASTTRRTRRPHPLCRRYASLFASASESELPPADDADTGEPEGQGQKMPGSPDNDASAAGGSDSDGGSKPEPRADEQVTGSSAEADAAEVGASETGDAPGAALAGESGDGDKVDWDKAWASTKQRMAKEKRGAPAFSGRKQVVASKNDEGGYDFEEISADGSSRMQGGKGSGGFGFADSNQVEGADGPGRVRRQEQEAVNLATTNQVRGEDSGCASHKPRVGGKGDLRAVLCRRLVPGVGLALLCVRSCCSSFWRRSCCGACSASTGVRVTGCRVVSSEISIFHPITLLCRGHSLHGRGRSVHRP